MAETPTGFLTTLGGWRDRATARLQGSSRGPVMRGLRILVLLAIVALLLIQLGHVGWGAIWSALPTQPLFYALLVLAYVSLPVAETFIYRMLWRQPGRDTFFACARKRVLNEEVFGYSGEVFFYLWGAGKGIEAAHAFRSVRDANIVSSLVSFLVAGVLVGLMMSIGALDVSGWIGEQAIYGIAGLVVLAGLIAVGLRFRHYVFSLSKAQTLEVAGWYLARHVVANVALVGMWRVAQPAVGLSVWLTFAAVLVVIERLPFLPSKDLVFVGAGVELSKTMSVATATMAGMLLVQSGVFKLLHVSVFLASALILRRGEAQDPGEASGLRRAEKPPGPPHRPVESAGVPSMPLVDKSSINNTLPSRSDRR